MAAPAEKALEQPTAAQAEVETAEDVLEIDAGEQVLGRKIGHPGEAAAVVFRALLGVGQDGIGGGDLLEALLGARFLVAVRVVFQRELAEGVLDRLGVGIPGEAEDPVVVALGGDDGFSRLLDSVRF
jgi:hypothetical protein